MDNPLSVQELMVVTFTKAAAQEMSARIGLALAKTMESTDDAALQSALNDSSICCPRLIFLHCTPFANG